MMGKTIKISHRTRMNLSRMLLWLRRKRSGPSSESGRENLFNLTKCIDGVVVTAPMKAYLLFSFAGISMDAIEKAGIQHLPGKHIEFGQQNRSFPSAARSMSYLMSGKNC